MTSSIDHLPQTEHLQTALSPTPKFSRLVRLLFTGLFAAVIIFLLPFVTPSCISLLKPVAVSILQRLWNVLRFLVITTIISLSILNTQRKTTETAGSRTKDDEHGYSSAFSMGRMDTIFNDNRQQKGIDQVARSDSLADERPRRISSFRVRDASHQEFVRNVDHRPARPASVKRSAEDPVQVSYQAKKVMISERAGDSSSTLRSRTKREDSSKQVETPGSRGNKEVATSSRFVLSSRNSRSALNLYQFDVTRKISRTNSGRHTSASCDFGDDYSPEWLYVYPLPPPPPNADSSSDSEPEASPTPKTTEQTDSSLKTLAALRSSPVDIARSSNPSVTQAPPPPVEEGISSISPSPGEVNRKADAFIAKFHEQMRMQLLESYERRRRS